MPGARRAISPTGGAERDPDRDRAGALARLCASANGSSKVASPAGVPISARSAVAGASRWRGEHVAAGAEGDRARASSEVRLERLGVGRDDRAPVARRARRGSRPSPRRSPRACPSSSRWTGPTLVIAATSGSAISQSSAIWPRPRIAISSTSISVSGGAARIVSGSPISVLKFSGLAWTRPGRSAAAMSLTDVLPVEPVIPTTGQPSSRRQARASRCSASQRVGGGEDPAAAAARPRSVGGAIGVDDHPPGAGGERRRRELAAVGALAAEAEEEVARAAASRESITARSGGPPAPSGGDLAAGLGGDPLRRELDHARGRRERRAAPRGRRRGRRRGSSGRPRTPGPARGPCRRSRRCRPARPRPARGAIAARRSGSTSTSAPPSPIPARISAMIASGSSERGLSEVTTARSASRSAIAPISGRLSRSRSPPQPKTQIRRRPAGDLARRDEHVLERVGRVRVVDEDGERLALVDRLEAARHPLGARRAPRPRRRARSRARRRRRSRRARSRR